MEEDNNKNLTNDKKEIEENSKGTAIIEVKKVQHRKGSYFAGTIGAMLGGLVAALPWILTYIFTNNMVIPLLATLIPIGAFLGYRIFRGKIGKPFSVVVAIVSILIISLVTTAICPMILMLKSGYPVNWDNLVGLYSDVREDVRTTIIEDTVAGLLFAIIGIVFTKKVFIDKKVKGMTRQQEKILKHEKAKEMLKEQSQVIKNACLDLNSMSKETATKKKEILKQLTEIYNIKRKKAILYFSNTKSNKLLRKHKGKYYYDETDEEIKLEKARKVKKRKISKKTIFITILLIAVIGASVAYAIINRKEHYLASEGGAGIEIEIDSTQDYYGTDEDIAKAFGQEFAQYYDFIIYDKNNKYELYGTEIPNENYANKDFATIIQEDRNYYAPYIGEESMSQVEDKQLGEHKLKSYNYTYTGTSGKQYRAVIYLYESGASYLWINVYSDLDIELTQIDTIIDNLLK